MKGETISLPSQKNDAYVYIHAYTYNKEYGKQASRPSAYKLPDPGTFHEAIF